MAETGGYVAPVQIGKSYADMFKEQMAEIQKQQAANLSSQIARRDANNALRYQQLEKIYGFKMDGWSPQAIQSFNDLQREVSRRMKDAEFETVEDMIEAISKLGTVHTGLTNHFQTAKSELLKTTQYVDNPGLYPDKTSRVIDTQETLAQKKRYADSLGVNGKWEADLQNIDINIPMIGLDGTPIGEIGYGSVMSHPHLADPTILSPSTRPIGDITPQDYAMEFTPLVTNLAAAGKGNDEVRRLVRKAMDTEFANEDASTVYRNSAYNIYSQKYGGKLVEDPYKEYIDEAMQYISIPRATTTKSSAVAAKELEGMRRFNIFVTSMEQREIQPVDYQGITDPTNPAFGQRVIRAHEYMTNDLDVKLNVAKYADRLVMGDSGVGNELDQIMGAIGEDGQPAIEVSFDSVVVDQFGNMTLKGITNESDTKQLIKDELKLDANEDADLIYTIVSILDNEYGYRTSGGDITLDRLKNGFFDMKQQKDSNGNPVYGGVKFNG